MGFWSGSIARGVLVAGEDMDVLLSELDLSVHARGASWK
jgi:hypothetical protein